jgi:hypothetical protein
MIRILIRASYALAAVATLAVSTACNASSPGVLSPVASTGAQKVPRASNVPAEIFNEILTYPCNSSGTSTCPIDFEIVFAGNQTADIPSNEPMSVHENAFCPVSGSSGCDPSVTYNASNNTTTVEYSGSTLYHNRASGKPGVHFGMMKAQNFQTNLKQLQLATYWTYASAPNNPVPVISINAPQPKSSKNWKYAIVFVAGSTAKTGGVQYGTWNEIAYVPKATPGSRQQQPKFTFKNYGSQTIYVQSSGVILDQPVPTDPTCLKTPACTENQKLLAALQEVNYPPPYYSGSPFTALQHPPQKVLKPME